MNITSTIVSLGAGLGFFRSEWPSSGGWEQPPLFIIPRSKAPLGDLLIRNAE